MERGISIFFLLVFAISGMAFLLVGRVQPVPIGFYEDRAQQSILDGDSLITDTDYKAVLKDTMERKDGSAPWVWTVEKKEGHASNLVLGDKVPALTFPDTGVFLVRAFYRMREVGRDTVHVNEGDRLLVHWPPNPKPLVDEPLEFKDDSPNVKERKWTIQGSDSSWTSALETFRWIPQDTGQYRAELSLTTNSGKVLEETWPFQVRSMPPPAPLVAVAPKPRPTVVQDRKPVVHVERPRKEKPKPPPEEKPLPPPRKVQCFTDRGSSTAFIAITGEPKRNDVAFVPASFTFTLRPASDCTLTGFNYWGNYKVGTVTVSVRCLSEGCIGRSTAESKFVTGNDNYTTQAATLRLPGLRAGNAYEVSVRPDPGVEMGFAALMRKTYNAGGVAVEFPEARSSVFDLKFKK